MAATYTLIASNTLGSSAASVTFSSIPQTYTDLVLRCSVRSSQTGNAKPFYASFNGTYGATTYSITQLYATGSIVASSRESNYLASIVEFATPSSSATSNTFSSIEIVIPSYTVSRSKPISLFGVAENNSTTDYTAGINAVASLWRDNSAITSITLGDNYDNFVVGSSFFLYGLKSS